MPFVLLVGPRITSKNVDFGFLIADANARCTVDRPDLIAVGSQRGE